MEKTNPEVNNLLNKQKQLINKVETQKILLLEAAEENKEFDELKKALDWNDTDKSLDSELRKNLELENRLKENNTKNILTEELVYDYCLKNNYALCKLRDYKGKISKEFLKAINDYFVENKLTIHSEANTDNMFVLCPFTDIKGNNDNIKKSKRYDKNRDPKLILLHKLDNNNAYTNNHYKIVCEQGVKRPITNFIRSIFFTHTKTQNFFNNTVVWLGGFLIILFIVTLVNALNSNILNTDYIVFFKYYISIALGILIIKTILPILFEIDPDVSLNYYADENYKDICERYYATKTFLTSYLFVNRRFRGSELEFYKLIPISKIRLRVQTSFWIMLIGFYLISNGLLLLSKDVVLIAKSPLIQREWVNEEKTRFVEQKTIRKGIFNYKTTIDTIPRGYTQNK